MKNLNFASVGCTGLGLKANLELKNNNNNYTLIWKLCSEIQEITDILVISNIKRIVCI